MPRDTHTDVVDPVQDPAVAGARAHFLTGDPYRGAAVRTPILASWRRSREHGVDAIRVDPPRHVGSELDTSFARTADPALRALAAALTGQPVTIVLTDQHGLVLTRYGGDGPLARTLDRLLLAPGFVYAEEFVGTNGIGTALEIGGPAQVTGHEHFAEHLEDLACAAAPIHHPLTGRCVGVIDLTCRRRDAGSLLMPLAMTTAAQITQALLDDSRPGTRQLIDEYLRVCQRASTMVLAVGSGLGMINDRARAILEPADQAVLMRAAAQAGEENRRGRIDVDLPSGAIGRITCQPVHDSGLSVGIVVRARLLDRGGEQATPASSPSTVPQLPGLVGRAPAWTHLCRRAEDQLRADTWLALTGEPGTGKLSVLRALQLRRQPAPRLIVLDGHDSAGPSWAERLDSAFGGGRTDSVVISHLDAITGAPARRLLAALETAAVRDEAHRPWVGATMSEADLREETHDLVALFPSTLVVPPLRAHPEDIAPLAAHFLTRLGGASPPRYSTDALAMLGRAAWPGNARQLLDLTTQVLGRRRSGVVLPADLPPAAHSTARRQLSAMEAMARDAIVTALADCDGDKGAAATALGMSRATIYRKIRAYGIVAG